MPTATLRTARQYLDEAKKLLDQPTFNREAEAKFDALFRLAESGSGSEYELGKLSRRARMELAAQTIDPATLAFFRGHWSDEKEISVSGGRIENHGLARIGGKPAGAMTVLRDCSTLFAPEHRTYVGLTTAAGADGGNTIPIGFIPTVFAAMKRTDQILEAANWGTTATSDGRPTNLPSLTDTATSAVKVTEGGPSFQANPSAFATLFWPEATTWSSQVILASIQLDQDAGVNLASLLADAFRIRFARGFGAECVRVLLADAPTGASTGSSPNVTELDLLALLATVDPAYAASDTAGWAMNWNTLLGIFNSVITGEPGGGSALYLAKMDDRGHYLLLGKPVYISPSLPNVGSGNHPVLFGDWSRFLIRHVPTEAVIRRFDEIYMPNHQLGFEMLFRADPKIMHAGGPGDDPIKALACT